MTAFGQKQSSEMHLSSGTDERDFAITAAYFHLGLEAGIFCVEQVRDWALAIVECAVRAAT
ncbi:hypothetical protein [uncultured Xylophilus sp.]|uniref:hypothetical protein n=1 Tax=uncultured Xylophilus sp. TaxID=296832 RepID=UPI0025F3F339|nr:hypothetical protein [uncultured Xylophilus sp.]